MASSDVITDPAHTTANEVHSRLPSSALPHLAAQPSPGDHDSIDHKGGYMHSELKLAKGAVKIVGIGAKNNVNRDPKDPTPDNDPSGFKFIKTTVTVIGKAADGRTVQETLPIGDSVPRETESPPQLKSEIAPQKNSSNLVKGTTGAAGALNIVMGAANLPKHISELGQGEYVKGGLGTALDGANIYSGVVNGTEAIAPGMLKQSVVKIAEELGPYAMVAGMVYGVASAAPGEKEMVAGKIAVSTAATTLTSGVATGVSGFLLPVAAGAAAGIAFEQDIKISELEHKHAAALSSLTPGTATLKHLHTVADGLEQTIQTAKFSDLLAKDKEGRIDLNNVENLQKIKAGLDPEDAKAIEHLSQAAQKRGLQNIGYIIENAAQERKILGESEKDFILDANGKVDLHNAGNLERITKDIARDRAVNASIMDSASQMEVRPDFTRMDVNIPFAKLHLANGETDLRRYNAAEERVKTLDTAMAELSYIANSGDKSISSEFSQQQLKEAVAVLQASKDPDKNISYTYTVHDGKFQPAKNSNQPVPDDVARQFTADPVHRDIQRVIFKSDGHGGQAPEKLITWQIIDPEVKQQAALPLQENLSPMEKARLQALAVMQKHSATYNHQDTTQIDTHHVVAVPKGNISGGRAFP